MQKLLLLAGGFLPTVLPFTVLIKKKIQKLIPAPAHNALHKTSRESTAQQDKTPLLKRWKNFLLYADTG